MPLTLRRPQLLSKLRRRNRGVGMCTPSRRENRGEDVTGADGPDLARAIGWHPPDTFSFYDKRSCWSRLDDDYLCASAQQEFGPINSIVHSAHRHHFSLVSNDR
jgi:hypothetical protein